MKHDDRAGRPAVLTSTDEVEAIVGRPAAAVMLKQIGALDEGCRTVLQHSPIAAFGYRDVIGVGRTTFVGGRPGFAQTLSPTRLAFAAPEPDIGRGPGSLFFLVPGVGEILRVNGMVSTRSNGEVRLDLEEAYIHCAQAVLRSRLWQPPVATGPELEFAGDGPLRAPGVAEFLAASPFLALSSWDSAGGGDTSPRGDRQTVVRILDGHTLVIPDRKGNKRADTLHNLLQDDRLSFAALAPGHTGVLHVRGRGMITDDADLLETMALRGMAPHLALVIDVDHAEVRGNDAIARSRLWNPATHLERATAPDLMALGGQHLAANSSMAAGGPPAIVLKALGAIPGVNRLLRMVGNRFYRSGLQKEGYDDILVHADVAAGPPNDGDPKGKPPREVRVAELRQETATALTLVLEDSGESAQTFDFRPGQFFTLVVDIDGRTVRRAYSASGAPGTTRLEVTVKQVDGGRFSTHVHRNLRVGDRLSVLGPSGSFHLGPTPPDDLLLVAAGSGVTPMMSMIRTHLAGGGPGRIALLYSSRGPDEVIFSDELDRLVSDHPDRLSVTHTLTSREGRLDEAGIRRWLTGLSPVRNARYYLCGPEPLMETAQGVLTSLEIPDDLVHHERYASGTDGGPTTTVPQQMVVEDNGQPVGTVIVEPGQTLLDAGLAAGLPMPHSCTVGNCGDCMVRLRSGEVSQSEPNCLTPDQRADGYVLACVGCPLSKVTLDIMDP